MGVCVGSRPTTDGPANENVNVVSPPHSGSTHGGGGRVGRVWVRHLVLPRPLLSHSVARRSHTGRDDRVMCRPKYPLLQ